jgi:hypothetical protein
MDGPPGHEGRYVRRRRPPMTRYLRADGSFDTDVGVVGMTSQPVVAFQ